jgi:toxin ParE1/3/4
MTMGTARIVLHPEVPEDLQTIITYLAERSPAAADRFAQAVPGSLEDVARFSGAGSLRAFKDARLEGVRSWRIRGFKKYLAFYRPTESEIYVLAVLHGARDVEAAMRGRS